MFKNINDLLDYSSKKIEEIETERNERVQQRKQENIFQFRKQLVDILCLDPEFVKIVNDVEHYITKDIIAKYCYVSSYIEIYDEIEFKKYKECFDNHNIYSGKYYYRISNIEQFIAVMAEMSRNRNRNQK